MPGRATSSRGHLVVPPEQPDKPAKAPSTQSLLNRQAIIDRLERANAFLRAGITDAAFLLFWVSIETLLKQLATRQDLPLERIPSSTLLKELFAPGILSRNDLEMARLALTIRNALVHGFKETGVDQTAAEMARLAQQLLAELYQHVV